MLGSDRRLMQQNALLSLVGLLLPILLPLRLNAQETNPYEVIVSKNIMV